MSDWTRLSNNRQGPRTPPSATKYFLVITATIFGMIAVITWMLP